MGAEAREDAALVAAVALGDAGAFRTRVVRHLAGVLAVARRMLRDDAEAEDVAQDAFLRVWQHAERWRPEGGRFTTWFYRVVVNESIDRLR